MRAITEMMKVEVFQQESKLKCQSSCAHPHLYETRSDQSICMKSFGIDVFFHLFGD